MAVRRFIGTRTFHTREGGHRAWASLKRFLLSWRVILGGTALVVVAGFGTVAWVVKDVPNPENISARRIAESTKIYDRTGTVLLYEIGDIRRTRVPLNDMAPFIRQATIATEDKNFYRHHGLNFRGILRALVANVRGKPLQGGSSITQQLVKNAILSPERTLTRKVREALLALEIERRFSKDEILEMYLNEIPYGSNAYGVESAARTFFGASAKDLTLAQAALLAALPKAPTYFSPYGSYTDELFARQKKILDSMAEQGFIKKEEAAAAQQVRLVFTKRRDAIAAPHFVFYVREQLEKEYGENLVTQGGLKVITTLDAAMQRAAEEAITAQAPKNLKYNAHNAALVAINPKTGDILAMVGSVDYFDTENDGNVNVAIRKRSPGSSFKPIVYAQAFRKGYTPETVLADVSIEFSVGAKSYRPGNFDLKTNGPTTMRSALARSLNIPAVQTLYLAGLSDTLALAREMGFTTLTDPDRYGLSLVLGGGEVRLLDEVSAYGVLALEGVRYPHRAILKVEDPSGRALLDNTKTPPEGRGVLEPNIARTVTDILSDNAARAPTFGARSPLQLGERPVAAKTGTAQEFRDGWTVGYTPSFVAGVWVGNNDNTPMSREPGAYTAAPIWNAFMRAVLSGTPIERFPRIEKTTTGKDILDGKTREMTVRYDKETNMVLPADCPVSVGTVKRFLEFRSVLHYVQKDDPRGAPPDTPERDPMYDHWEAGIAAWRDKWNNEHESDERRFVAELPQPQCDAALFEGRPEISFRQPEDEVIRSSPVRIAADISAPSRVTKVEFLANGKIIGERTEEPWEAEYRFALDLSGKVTLKILATTEEGKTSEAVRVIRVNPDSDAPRVRLLSPRPQETIPPSEFPFIVKVEAEDTRGIALVDVLYRPEDDKRTSRVGRTDTPTKLGGKKFDIPWQTAPAPGTYTVWVVATDSTGNTSQTAPITLTVP